MNIILEIIIAVLAAFGAVGIVICIFGERPGWEQDFSGSGEMISIITGGEDAAELQKSLTAMLWLRDHGARDMTILITDDALSQASRRYAENMCALDDGIFMCSTAEVFNL